MAIQNAINLTATGIVAHDGSGSFSGRTITQPAAGITVTNGDGVSGNPTIGLNDDLAAVEGLSGTGVITRTAADTWATNSISTHAIVIGSAGNTVTSSGPLTNGQLLIGNTGSAPSTATLTGGTGITISNGAGTITIDADNNGDVTGPGSSTDEALARFDGSTGKIIQNSSALLSDGGALTGLAQLQVDNIRIDGNTIDSTDTNGNIILEPNGTGIVTTSKSLSGNLVKWLIYNSDATAATDSSANIDITSRPEGIGDASLTVSIAATRSYCFGIDNSDSKILKINTDAAGEVKPSTGTNIWEMTADGERTMVLQPAFLAYLASNVTNATGTGTVYTVGNTALTEVFDQGSDFNTNGTFTAPVTGRYTLGVAGKVENCTAATQLILLLNTSNRNYRFVFNRASSSATLSGEVSVLADMDASDTFTFTLSTSGEASDLNTVSGASSNTETRMYGHLSC